MRVDWGGCREQGPKERQADSLDGSPAPTEYGAHAFAVADGVSAPGEGAALAASTAVRCAVSLGAMDPHVLTVVADYAMRSAGLVVQRMQRLTEDDCRTTLSLLLLRGTTGCVAHAGDSRVYRLRANELEVLTEDHRDGQGTLLRYLGSRRAGADPTPTITEVDVQAGDVFALLTDGVWEALPAEVIRDRLQRVWIGAHTGVSFCKQAADELVAEALRQGSTDNCTALVVHLA